VHVAQRVGALGGEHDEAVLLALALTVRSTRHGSVVLDLATAEESTSVDADQDEPTSGLVDLDWPQDWAARCAASPLVDGPLRQEGSRLWLARYWDQEALVAEELLTRSSVPTGDLDAAVLRSGLDRLFQPGDEDQRRRLRCARWRG
jgi:exodeoxyribonuclease V alpha subunit